MKTLIKNSITLSIVVIFCVKIIYAQTDAIVHTTSKRSNEQKDLFQRFNDYDKAMGTPDRKNHLPNVKKLPQVLPNTGGDPSGGESPIIDMPTRSKDDKGLMEGQNVMQHRKEMDEEANIERNRTILGIILVAVILIVLFKALPNRKDSNGNITLEGNEDEPNDEIRRRTVFKDKIE